MDRIYLDFETRSRVAIKEVGAWNYTTHESTNILCMVYTKTVNTAWTLVDIKDMITYAKQIAESDCLVVAHNVLFEYSVWYNILHKRYGVPMIPINRWRCTMVKVLTHNLPAGLGAAAIALGLDYKKDKEGANLMLKMCKPDRKGEWVDSVEQRKRLVEYCYQDTLVCMAIDKKLADISADELLIFCIDLHMNTQGIKIDTELAAIAKTVAEEYKEMANNRCKKITDGWVNNLTQISKLKDYCYYELGVKLDSLDKPTLVKLLDNPKTDKRIIELCKLRQMVGKSSVTKYSTALGLADKDGIVRGYLQYHGTNTGRWGGRGLQPQNLPRTPVEDMPTYIDTIKLEYNMGIRDSSIMDKLSKGIRGLLIPREGNKFLIADYSAIEARYLMWFVGEEEVTEAFRAGADIYLKMAEIIFGRKGLTKKANPFERNVGKATILGSGYAMGSKRFNDQCDTKGVDLGPRTAKDFNGNPVSPLAIKCIDIYRNTYRKVVQYWAAMEEAFRMCMKQGSAETHGLKFRIEGDFLTIQLLSGRKLYYYKPFFKPVEGRNKPTICYKQAGDNGMLEDVMTHGGTLVAHANSAMCRDIMTHALPTLYKLKYNPVLSIHDELVCEVPIKSNKTVDEMIKIMIDIPAWAKGCPINAEGMESSRYCK